MINKIKDVNNYEKKHNKGSQIMKKNSMLIRNFNFKYGVGKLINNCIYIHKSCYEYLQKWSIEHKKEIGITLNDCHFYLTNNYSKFDYDVIKYDNTDNSFSFVKVDDFNNNPEPIILEGYKVKNSINLNKEHSLFINKLNYPQNNPLIYHSRYLFVKEDYKGFNYKLDQIRTLYWKLLITNNKEYCKIGKSDYWNKHYKPILDKIFTESKLELNKERINCFVQ